MMRFNKKCAISLDKNYIFPEGMHDLIPSPSPDPLTLLIKNEEEREKEEKVQKALSILSWRERMIILDWMENVTLKVTGEGIGISYERVRQIREIAIRKIQNYFGVNSLKNLPLFKNVA